MAEVIERNNTIVPTEMIALRKVSCFQRQRERERETETVQNDIIYVKGTKRFEIKYFSVLFLTMEVLRGKSLK